MAIDTQTEATTSQIRLLLTDVDGRTALTNLSGVLSSLVLTLYDRGTLTVLNSRYAQTILNANGFTVYDTVQTDGVTGETYNVQGRLDPADNAIVGTGAAEPHVARIGWSWGTPLKVGSAELTILVRNQVAVPPPTP